MIQGMVLSIGMIGDAMRSADGSGDIAGQMNARMVSMIGPQMVFTAVLSFTMMLLLAAAFVRRLHDGGFSGWIALIPASLVTASLLLAYRDLDEIRAAVAAAGSGEQLEIAAHSFTSVWQIILGWLPYIIFAVLGAWPSQKRENRWGPYVPPAPKTDPVVRQPARMRSRDDYA